jgi:hypothetical protein
MLFPGTNGPTLISEEFNQLCIDTHVEVTVRPLPNPGDPYQAVRMLEFKSFSDQVILVTQNDSKRTTHYIPARGSIQMILNPGEPLPNIEKVSDGP